MNVLSDLPVVVIPVRNLDFVLSLVFRRYTVISVINLLVESLLVPPIRLLTSAYVYSLGPIASLYSSRGKSVSSSKMRSSRPASCLCYVIISSLNFVLLEEFGSCHACSSEFVPVGQLHILAFAKYVLSSPCVKVVEEQVLSLSVVGIEFVLLDLLLVDLNPDLLAQKLVVLLCPGSDNLVVGLLNNSS